MLLAAEEEEASNERQAREHDRADDDQREDRPHTDGEPRLGGRSRTERRLRHVRNRDRPAEETEDEERRQRGRTRPVEGRRLGDAAQPSTEGRRIPRNEEDHQKRDGAPAPDDDRREKAELVREERSEGQRLRLTAFGHSRRDGTGLQKGDDHSGER